MSENLIIYYSRAGENYFQGDLKYVEKGNTEYAAEEIQKLTGGDVFRIEMKEPYSDKYRECVNEAVEDYKSGKRPELLKYPDSVEKYENIYLGFPNFCGTIPMPVASLIEKCDFKGKNIYPFITHEGSGFKNSIEDLKKIMPDAVLKKGLEIIGTFVNTEESKNKIRQWIEESSV